MKSPRSIWVVSNKFFHTSVKVNSFYIKGFSDNLRYGYNFKDSFIGYQIDLLSDGLIIKNDPLSTLPVYYFFKNGNWACSNNLWELCQFENFNINWEWFRKNSFYYHSPKEGETFINDVFLLNTGSYIHCDENKLVLKSRNDNLFIKPSLKKISNEKVVIEKIISSLDEFFEIWKGKSNLYLGNSGGFDSRLMRAFLNHHRINYNSYTTLRVKKNHNLLSSTTEFCANKCDSLYGKSNYYYKNELFQLNEDIIWNPLGSAESSKVPLDLHRNINSEENPYVFCGGNGYIAGYNQVVWGNLNQCNHKDIPEFFLKGFSYGNIYKNSLERRSIYGEENFKNDLFEIQKLLNKTENTTGLNVVRFLQSRLLNKYSPAGGYESVLFSGFPVYMYYPSLTSFISEIDDSILNNRNLLEKIILKVDPRLNFRGQNGKKPLKEINLYSKIWTKLRGTGIQNINITDKEYENFIENSSNNHFLKEISMLFPVKKSLDFFDKLKKFDSIINKLKSENIY